MNRPYLRVRIYAIRSQQTKILHTGFDGSGLVTVERTEWGVGKGGWKREVRKAADQLGLDGEIKVFYFLLGSRYKLKYRGRAGSVRALHDGI